MRQVTDKEIADVHHRHKHHAPTSPAVCEAHNKARQLTEEYAVAMLSLLPEKSREASLFMTKVDEARMWANAAIACNQPPPTVG